MKIQQAAQNKQCWRMEKQKKNQQQPKYVEHIHEFVSDSFQFSILQININIFILFTCGRRRFVIHVKNGRVLDTNWPGSDPRAAAPPAPPTMESHIATLSENSSKRRRRRRRRW